MTLLADPAKIASRLGITDPSTDVLDRIEEAILDSQAKVEGFLNRASLFPESRVLVGLYPDPLFPMNERDAWPQAVNAFDDRYEVVSWAVNADDPSRYDVTFSVGLDARDVTAEDGTVTYRHPIGRFVARDAMEQLRADAIFCTLAGVARAVSSVSAGGQSVSYEKGSTAEDGTGAAISIKSLGRFKRRAIYQRPMSPFTPWPYA